MNVKRTFIGGQHCVNSKGEKSSNVVYEHVCLNVVNMWDLQLNSGEGQL